MNNAQTEAARRARNAAAARARRQDPAVTARQAEAKRARREANPELRLREAAAKRARRQANPELRRREAEAKRARRQADPTVKDREAEARRKRRQAKLEVRAGDDSATAKRQKQSPLHVGGADARVKRECFNQTFGRSSEVCDRLGFDNNVTITASIRNGRSRANAAAVFPREFPVTSPDRTPDCREQRVCAIYDVAVRGVLLRRCPCGQAINTNDASQLLGWKIRKDVSIQCGLQEMAPLPLQREVFPSAAHMESIRKGTSCNQAGNLPSEFKNGMDHGAGSAVGCHQLFQCHRCQYSTPKLHRLTCHLQSHSAEKPFRCEVCPAAFKGVHAYKAHMCKHTGEVLYQCHLCPYTTSYRTLLMDHKRAHLNTMSFACNMCAYKTKKKANLHMHKLYHKRDMPFKCKICSFGYNDKRYLKSHMRQHLKS